MKHSPFRAWLIAFALGGLALTSCTRFIGTPPLPVTTPTFQATLPPTPTLPPVVLPPEGRRVTVSEVVNTVEAKSFAESPFESVGDGTVIGLGGQVRTGAESRARVDLSESAVVRLGADTVFGLEALTDSAGGQISQVSLDLGRLWASVSQGTLQVLTPIGLASVRGSFAVFEFSPGNPNDPNDDTLTLDCLEGICSAQASTEDIQIGNLERLVIAKSGAEVSRLTLTDLEVQEFIANNPEAASLLGIALTAAIQTPVTETPSSAETPTSDTPTGPTAVPVLGKHSVRSGESLFCIGRAYGVLPSAIAQANGLDLNAKLTVSQDLIIPAVRWFNIPGGPICVQQFNSPFPAGPFSPPTQPPPIYYPPVGPADTPTPELPPTEIPPPTPTPLPVCVPPEYYDASMDRCRILDTPAP